MRFGRFLMLQVRFANRTGDRILQKGWRTYEAVCICKDIGGGGNTDGPGWYCDMNVIATHTYFCFLQGALYKE